MPPPLSNLESRRAALEASLASLRSPSDRLAWLVERARQAPALPDDRRTEENRIEGCLARLWVTCRREDGRCHFACDSDSLVVKAIALVLCELHSGCTPDELLASDPADLVLPGLTQHITPNRRNALSKIMDRFRRCAIANSR